MQYNKASSKCRQEEWVVDSQNPNLVCFIDKEGYHITIAECNDLTSDTTDEATAALMVHEHKHFKQTKDDLGIALELLCTKCSASSTPPVSRKCDECEVSKALDRLKEANEVK